MNSPAHLGSIRRILVAIDASPDSLAALEIASNLAYLYSAELIGIYVEDINLIRMADLPFAREIGHFSAILRPINSTEIERQLRAHRRWIESIFASIAGDKNLQWSFRTFRGAITEELLSAARDTDLILLGRSGWSGRRRIGSTARRLAIQSPIQAMILSRQLTPKTKFLLVYDGSDLSQKALEAVRILGEDIKSPNVLLLADDLEQANQLRSEVDSSLPGLQNLKYIWLRSLDLERVSQILTSEGCELIILPASSPHFDIDAVLGMLDESNCAVLIVH
jgi:nucleotide-binding universal stress UspA family protein